MYSVRSKTNRYQRHDLSLIIKASSVIDNDVPVINYTRGSFYRPRDEHVEDLVHKLRLTTRDWHLQSRTIRIRRTPVREMYISLFLALFSFFIFHFYFFPLRTRTEAPLRSNPLGFIAWMFLVRSSAKITDIHPRSLSPGFSNALVVTVVVVVVDRGILPSKV